jgi:hypothetical protein
MSLVTSIRLRQQNLIDQNPASVTITRKAKTSDGAGGWVTTTTTITAQTIRIYFKKTRTLNISDGGWHSVKVTKAIAPYNANIKKYTANNEDTFTHNGKTWRVFDVEDRTVLGEVVFKELELEQL